MTSSHAAGWASDAPTPAQLKEFYDQISSGKVTRLRFQEFLRHTAEPGSIFISQPFELGVYNGREAIQRHVRDGKNDGRFRFVDGSVCDANFPQGPFMNQWTDKKSVRFLWFGRRIGRDEALREIDRLGSSAAGAAEILALARQFPKTVYGGEALLGLGQYARLPDNRGREDDYFVAATPNNRDGISIMIVTEKWFAESENIRFVIN